MITPITEDEAWLTALGGLATWQPPLLPTFIVAPHPDDETLGAGALIASLRSKGVALTVIAATDGENAYDIPASSRFELAGLRTREQGDALARLGVPAESIVRLHLQDSGLHRCEQPLADALMKHVPHGAHLIAPWSGDFHPDHEACARAAAAVAEAKGLHRSSYFFWTWHRGETSLLAGLPVRRFVPSDEALRAKAEALRCHRSQFEYPGVEPILPERLLAPAFWPFEVFLPA